MRDPRSLLASVAASATLVAAATLALLTASAVVAFHGWPVGGSGAGAPVALPSVPSDVAAAREAVVVPATKARRRIVAVARRAVAPLRHHDAAPARGTVTTAPAARPTASTPAPVTRAPAPAPSVTRAADPSPGPAAVPAVPPVPAPPPAPDAGPADPVVGAATDAVGAASDAAGSVVPAP